MSHKILPEPQSYFFSLSLSQAILWVEYSREDHSNKRAVTEYHSCVKFNQVFSQADIQRHTHTQNTTMS